MHPPISNQFEAIAMTVRRNSKTRKGVRRPRSGMGVAWSKRCQIKDIPTLTHYSDEEKSNCFCGAEDYERMREETAEVSFLMKHGTKESDEVSYRGLEGKREGDSRRRRIHRFTVNAAVFQENDKQYEQGHDDPEAIADIYRLMTQSSRVEALERAAQDAKDVGQEGAAAPSPLSGQEQGEESDTDSVNTLVENYLLSKLSQKVGKQSRKSTNLSHLFAQPAQSAISSREGLVVLASVVAQQ
jgi:hypothetical protein